MGAYEATRRGGVKGCFNLAGKDYTVDGKDLRGGDVTLVHRGKIMEE